MSMKDLMNARLKRLLINQREKELTGADVSRMLKDIEKDLEQEADKSVDRHGKPFVEVDEVRLYRNGKDTGLRTRVFVNRMYAGDSLDLKVHFDIT